MKESTRWARLEKFFPANEQQPSKVFYPSKEAAPMNKLNSSEILVKHEISVQRLPRGQNLVSVTRPGMFLLNFSLKKMNKIKYNSGIFFTIIFFQVSQLFR